MDWVDIILKGLPVVAGVLSIIAVVFMSMAGNRFISKRDGEKITKEVDDLKGRLTSAEAALDNVPRVDAIHELAISIEKMNGNIKGMSAQLVSLEKFSKFNSETMRRQEEFLLNFNMEK